MIVEWSLFILSWVAIPAATVSAAVFGGTPERIGAALIFGGSLASLLVVTVVGQRFIGVEVPMLVVDTIVLVAFICLSLKTKRFWPIWATSFHSIVVVTHLADVMAPRTLPLAYAILQGFWVYPMTIALLIGVYGHKQAMKSGAESLNS